MKLPLLLLGVSLYLAGYCSADFSDNQKQQFLEASQYCQKKLSIPDELNILGRAIYNRDFNYDELEKKYITCGHQQLGWLNADGHYDAQVTGDFFTDNYDAQKVKPLVKLCINDDIEPLTEKVAFFHRCFFSRKTFDL